VIAAPEPSRWRASPRRLARLLLGLAVFGAGEALVVVSELGNSPWTVFAEGVSVQTPLSIGAATVATSAVVLLLWVPLRERPGLGTLCNALLVGVFLDLTLLVVGEPSGVLARAAACLAGIVLVGVGCGLYLGARLGPGPRDGLMTGLHRRTGRPIAPIRGAIEVSALLVGVLLGGTVGVGTLLFAVLIGPAVAAGVRLLPGRAAPRPAATVPAA
jgi:uncharacterized membrane protein YczE